MLTTDFSRRSLRSMIRWRDGNDGVLKERHFREKYLEWLEKTIADNKFQFAKLKPMKVGSFVAYQPTALGDTLVLRKINSIIRNRYQTRQSDRNTIVQQTRSLLEENCPKYIYKIDIAKFYESIDRNVILNKLRSDNIISSTAQNLIAILFQHFSKYVKFGLPRGLSLSATLSELYLKELDKKIAEMDGVYYYARYVDDMIIFSSKKLDSVLANISDLLPGVMKLNREKCDEFPVGCRCEPSCSCGNLPCSCSVKCVCPAKPEHELNYLGYKILTSKVHWKKDLKKGMPIIIGMAERKINRIKNRVTKAFIDNHKSNDFDLLFQRIKFLTENHRIKTPGRRGRLMSGIHYNYPLINDIDAILKLNKFLQSQVYSNKGAFGIRQHATINAAQKQKIVSLSFVSGFVNKRSSSVSSHNLKKIRKCWQ